MVLGEGNNQAFKSTGLLITAQKTKVSIQYSHLG